MRLDSFVLTASTINAAVIDRTLHEKRQFPDFLALANVAKSFSIVAKQPRVQPFLTENLPAQKFPGALRRQVVWGPYKVQSAKQQNLKGQGGLKLDKHSDLFEHNLAGLCADCILLDARVDLTDKIGKKLALDSEIYTHHIILARSGIYTAPPLKPLGLCGSVGPASTSPKSITVPGINDLLSGLLGGFGNLFGGASAPTSPQSKIHPRQSGTDLLFGAFGNSFLNAAILLTKGHEADHVNWASYNPSNPKSGLWLSKDDTIINSVEIVNYKELSQDVYFTIDAEYLPMERKPVDYLDVGFASLVAVDCADPFMNIPKNKPKTYATSDHVINQDAYLTDFHPHLHDGAINMRLLVNNKTVCEKQAVYANDTSSFKLNGQIWETIDHYTACDAVPLKSGDKLKMTADYDLTKRRLRPSSGDHHQNSDSMAIAFIQLAFAQ